MIVYRILEVTGCLISMMNPLSLQPLWRLFEKVVAGRGFEPLSFGL